jgi:sporulation integral membrane protein YtvI
MDFKRIDFVRYASILICIVGGVALFYFALKYLLWAILPFLIAWGIAFLVRPATEYLHSKTRISRRLLSFVLVLLAFLLLGSVISLLVGQLASEIRSLVTRLEENPTLISEGLEAIREKLNALRGRLRLFDIRSDAVEADNILDEYIVTMAERGANAFLSSASKVIGKIILALPKVLIFTLVAIISAFYFSTDLKRVNEGVLSVLPPKWQEIGKRAKNTLFITGLKYLRAYLTIMLIVFVLLLVGFFILKVKYAFIISLVCALVDFLPVLGVGSVLIPWSIFAFATGNLKLGVGLLLIYLIIMVTRQIIEPKIVGANFGIHPLLTLFSMYLGFSFFGVFGMIIGPIVALTVKGSLSSKKEGSI